MENKRPEHKYLKKLSIILAFYQLLLFKITETTESQILYSTQIFYLLFFYNK